MAAPFPLYPSGCLRDALPQGAEDVSNRRHRYGFPYWSNCPYFPVKILQYFYTETANPVFTFILHYVTMYLVKIGNYPYISRKSRGFSLGILG